MSTTGRGVVDAWWHLAPSSLHFRKYPIFLSIVLRGRNCPERRNLGSEMSALSLRESRVLTEHPVRSAAPGVVAVAALSWQR